MAGSHGPPRYLRRPFDELGRAGTHQMRGAYGTASERNSIWSVIVPADGTKAATAGKRRLRYVCVFWAALGQAAACPYPITWDAGRKAQWLVEKLNAEHLLGVAQLANWRGGSRRKGFELNRAALAISAEEAPRSSRGRVDVSTADLANWRDRLHMRSRIDQSVQPTEEILPAQEGIH
jgi:hypothetical protein